jgi:hypothetical protein
MKHAALIFIFLCSSVTLANDRQWKDALVVNITSDASGAAAASTGTMAVAVPITRTFYWIQTEDMSHGSRRGRQNGYHDL